MMIVSHGHPDLKVVATRERGAPGWSLACYAVGQHVHQTVSALRLCAATLVQHADGAPWWVDAARAEGPLGPFDTASEALHGFAKAQRRAR